MQFGTPIRVLQDAREMLVQQLREAASATIRTGILAKKLEIDSAIELLTLLSEHDAGPHFRVTELPLPVSDGSEYRIMEDHETDDRSAWTELTTLGSPIRPLPRALVVESHQTAHRTLR